MNDTDLMTPFKNLIADAYREGFNNAMLEFKKPEPEPKNDNGEKLLTRSEASALLHVSLVSLWQYENKKILQPVRIGRRVLYYESDIKKCLRSKVD